MPLTGRFHDRVLEVELRLRELRAFAAPRALRPPPRAPDDRDLLRRRLRVFQRRLRLFFADVRLHQPALGGTQSGLRFGDAAFRRIERRALRIGRGNGRVVLLLRHFVLGEESFQALDVARRLRGVGLGLADE